MLNCVALARIPFLFANLLHNSQDEVLRLKGEAQRMGESVQLQPTLVKWLPKLTESQVQGSFKSA